MSQLTSVFCRVSKIGKDWCFLKHSQCWGSESCYQFHGWQWVGNAGIFHPKKYAVSTDESTNIWEAFQALEGQMSETRQ